MVSYWFFCRNGGPLLFRTRCRRICFPVLQWLAFLSRRFRFCGWPFLRRAFRFLLRLFRRFIFLLSRAIGRGRFRFFPPTIFHLRRYVLQSPNLLEFGSRVVYALWRNFFHAQSNEKQRNKKADSRNFRHPSDQCIRRRGIYKAGAILNRLMVHQRNSDHYHKKPVRSNLPEYCHRIYTYGDYIQENSQNFNPPDLDRKCFNN